MQTVRIVLLLFQKKKFQIISKKVLSISSWLAEDCRIEDSKRTGEDFEAAKAALGDLAKSEEDVMSYICFPKQAEDYLKARKEKEERTCNYTMEAID